MCIRNLPFCSFVCFCLYHFLPFSFLHRFITFSFFVFYYLTGFLLFLSVFHRFSICWIKDKFVYCNKHKTKKNFWWKIKLSSLKWKPPPPVVQYSLPPSKSSITRPPFFFQPIKMNSPDKMLPSNIPPPWLDKIPLNPPSPLHPPKHPSIKRSLLN